MAILDAKIPIKALDSGFLSTSRLELNKERSIVPIHLATAPPLFAISQPAHWGTEVGEAWMPSSPTLQTQMTPSLISIYRRRPQLVFRSAARVMVVT